MSKKLICSAGHNYGMIYPNGDIYRCMRDYNTRNKIVGNILKNGEFHSEPQQCNQKICNTSCDADWSTKWLLNNEEIYKKIPANGWDDVISINPWANYDINSKKNKNICMIIWTPTLPCNYTCSYCGCAAGTGKIYKNFPSSSPELNLKEWMNFFYKFKSKFDWALIQTNGGEPLTHEATIPVFEYVSDKFAINLVTNLSVKISEIVRSKIKPFDEKTDTGLKITASLHPTSKGFNFDIFLGKLLLLKKHKFLRGVNFVGWPEQIYLFDHYKKILNDNDIKIWLQPWVGPDNSGYEKYQPEEEEYISLNTHSSRNLSNQHDFSEFVETTNFDANLVIKNFEVEKKKILFNVDVYNTGSEKLITEKSNIKLGVKILRDIFGLRNSEVEFRSNIEKEINTKDKSTIKISVDTDGVPAGNYNLVVDLVKENEFWFGQLGNTAIEYQLIIKEKSIDLKKIISLIEG